MFNYGCLQEATLPQESDLPFSSSTDCSEEGWSLRSPFPIQNGWVRVCRPCAVTISALSSWARQLCHIRKTTYPEDVTSQLSFSSFDCCICSAPFSATFPESRRGQYRSVTQGWARAHSYLVLWPIVSVCPIHCPVQAEASPPQAESSTNPCV